MLFPPKDLHKTYSVGLDASLSSLGVYCRPFDPEKESYHWSLQSITTDGSDTRRVIDMATDIIEALSDLPAISIVSIEDYGPINRTSGKIAQRAEMCGIIKYHSLHHWRVPVITIPPPSLKSFATGNGRASKDHMLKAATRLSFYPDTHDEADAFFAARIGAFVMTNQTIGVAYERVNP